MAFFFFSFPFACVCSEHQQMAIFLQTQIQADGQLLLNSPKSFVFLPQATLSDCYKFRQAVGVCHMNCDLMLLGQKQV